MSGAPCGYMNVRGYSRACAGHSVTMYGEWMLRDRWKDIPPEQDGSGKTRPLLDSMQRGCCDGSDVDCAKPQYNCIQ